MTIFAKYKVILKQKMYKLIVKLFNTEMAYRLFMFNIKLLDRLYFLNFFKRITRKDRENLHCNVFGINLDSPVGLGAGLDKEGLYYNEFAEYGFSFVITGPTDSNGVRKSIEKIKKEAPRTTVLCCLSEDHTRAFSLAYDFMDAFVITAHDDQLKEAVAGVLETRLAYDIQKPVLMHIAHEFSTGTLNNLLDFALMNGVDGFVVGANVNVRKVNEFCKGRVPIIGYGAIRSAKAAEDMLNAGASLIALTTGVVLDGPSLIKRILNHLDELHSKN